MDNETPGLDQLVEATKAAVLRALRDRDTEVLETLDGGSNREDGELATFLRAADASRTSDLIMRIALVLANPVDESGEIDFEAQYDAIALLLWGSGLHEGSVRELSMMMESTYIGLLQMTDRLLSGYSADDVGRLFAELWRVGETAPDPKDATNPYLGLVPWPSSLRDHLARIVCEVVSRLLVSRSGREVTLAWAEAAAQMPEEDSDPPDDSPDD